ncbi:MAG: hypothetical protein CVU84_03955 [Firmicutes bacterium HGW-Firmicutes-1]|nr:MAG: hypothetical protein CVU84_03955 [Firmicutes bacterium HGW-Firmicutes-1]
MKLLDNIDSIMFAPCGMNCIVCYRHLKPKKSCKGCLCSDEDKPEHCRKCNIKDCVKVKRITYCFECGEFPCKQIKNLEKSYIKRYGISLVKNSETVRSEGLEFFMLMEKELWTCKKCSGIISLHDSECSECHLKIRSST